MIATAKGLGAGYAAIGAVLVRDRVFEAIASGSRSSRSDTPGTERRSPCAVGLAVLRRPATRGAGRPRPRARRAPAGRARGGAGRRPDGPRGARARLPARRVVRRSAERRHAAAAGARVGAGSTTPLPRGLITLSTQPTRDGYAGDQTLFAPPFTDAGRRPRARWSTGSRRPSARSRTRVEPQARSEHPEAET